MMVAKICKNCCLAEWQRTKTGRVSPTKSGECTFIIPEVPARPLCVDPFYTGRKRPIWRDNTEECPVFARA